MISRSQRSKRRDAALSTLDGFIQTLNVAKDTCGVPPAQIALASACILLTVIKVCSLLLVGGELPVHVYAEHNEQQR